MEVSYLYGTRARNKILTAYIFQTIANKGSSAGIKAGTQDAIKWFRNEAYKVTTVSAPKMMATKENLMSNLKMQDIGRMFMYFYDPKMKEVLPYYDKFPLILLVEMAPDGFYGLNLHYISPQLRAKLMDALWALRTNDKYDDTTKLKLSYKILKGASRFRYFAPCFKRYLFNHVQSKYLYIEAENWDKALMLPTERFAKADKAKVFRDSFLSVD